MINNNGIPNEILLLIIQHIPRSQRHTLFSCSLVNKQFHTIVNPLLWKKLIVSTEIDCQRLLTSLHTASQYQRPPSILPGQHIQRLSFRGYFLDDDQLLRLLPHVPQLESFKVPFGTRITDMSMQRLPRYCTFLHHLQLESISLTRSCFTSLARHCPQLCQLDLRHCSLDHANILQPIAKACPIQHLILFNCTLDTQTIVTDLIQLDGLITLELIGIQGTIMKSLLLLATIPTTMAPWPVLKKINLPNLMYIDDTIWLAFINSHRQLQDISMMNASLTDAIMIPMARSLPQLKYIGCIASSSGTTTHGIRQLIRYASPDLECIRCAMCPAIRASDFNELSESPMVNFKNDLVKLDTTAINIIRSTRITGRINKNNNV